MDEADDDDDHKLTRVHGVVARVVAGVFQGFGLNLGPFHHQDHVVVVVVGLGHAGTCGRGRVFRGYRVTGSFLASDLD